MIKTIVFDIDGVLVSTRQLHEKCFLQALQEAGILLTHERHQQELDGLPTKVKLQHLRITPELHDQIAHRKKELTFSRLSEEIHYNPTLAALFEHLVKAGYHVAVASNAIRTFCELVIDILKLPVDLILSAEQTKPKPHADMYLQAMRYFHCSPHETLICEDSTFGLQAAYRSQAYVLHICDPSFLTEAYLLRFIKMLN